MVMDDSVGEVIKCIEEKQLINRSDIRQCAIMQYSSSIGKQLCDDNERNKRSQREAIVSWRRNEWLDERWINERSDCK